MTISLFRCDATRAGSGAAWDWIFFLLNLDLIFRYPSNVLQNGRYWKFHCSLRSNRVYCMLIEWLLEVVGKCEGLIRMCTTCWMLTCYNNNMIFENRDGASSYVNLSIIIQFSVHTHPPPTPVAISASLCGLCSSKGKNSPYCSCLYAAAFHSLDDEHELPTFNWSVPRYCFSRPIVGPSILTPEPLKGILSGNWKGSFSTDLNKSGYPHTHTFELLITNGVRVRIRKWVSHSGLIDDDLGGASPSRKLNPIREPSGPSFYLPQGYLPTKFTKITLNELCVNELRHHEDIELRMRRGLHCFPSIVE